jgi:hypothetical protein
MRVCRPALAALCSVAILLPLTFSSAAQFLNWWTLSDSEVVEKGRFRELLTKRNVYISVTFSDARQNSPVNSAERNDIIQAVHQAVSFHKELHVVAYPEEADFAVLVRASTAEGRGDRGPNFSLLLDPEAEVSIEVSVVVPGAGGRPRLVWEASSPNAQVEAVSAARFTVNGFLWELKKLRERR